MIKIQNFTALLNVLHKKIPQNSLRDFTLFVFQEFRFVLHLLSLECIALFVFELYALLKVC